MQQIMTRTEVLSRVGTELGVSAWFHLDQARVDEFADVTLDHQFIHVDPERAAQGPFGGTIAHGLLTLSLIVHLCIDLVPKLEGATTVLNYGFNRVRFVAPLRVGKRIRGRAKLAEVREHKPGQFLVVLEVTVEIEGESKPALVAEWLSLHVVDTQ